MINTKYGRTTPGSGISALISVIIAAAVMLPFIIQVSTIGDRRLALFGVIGMLTLLGGSIVHLKEANTYREAERQPLLSDKHKHVRPLKLIQEMVSSVNSKIVG